MRLFSKVVTTAVIVFCGISSAGATLIEEISVDSVDTVYDLSPNATLTIAQNGVSLVIERTGNVQQTIADVDFSMITYLQTDLSTPAGQAIADFAGGTITISDATSTLLTADIGVFTVEENVNLPFALVTGSGDFNVTGGSLSGEFGPAGVIFDVTWRLSQTIDDFSEPFTAESDVTLTPEPSTLLLLMVGGIFALRRRRKC